MRPGLPPRAIGKTVPVSSYPIAGQGIALDLNGQLPLAIRKTLPGFEFAYTEFTASVSITATTEGTAQQIVSAGAINFDGSTAVYLDFWCPFLLIGAGTPTVEFFDGSTSLGGIQVIGSTVLGYNMRRRVTPTSSAHTYAVKAFTSAGTATVGAGAGGPATGLPGFIRVAKA